MKLLIGCLIVFFLLWDLFWMFLGINPMPPWQLAGRLKSSADPPVLLDVRTATEYKWFHIKGARNTPELFFNIDALRGVPKDSPIVVICMSGHRSEIVAYLLKREGYGNVSNLTWGMLGWKLLGKKTVSGETPEPDTMLREAFRGVRSPARIVRAGTATREQSCRAESEACGTPKLWRATWI